jgi:hypothetical protein
MGNVIKLRRLGEGFRLSKEATKNLVSALRAEFTPRRSANGLPRSFKPANETSNMYGVAVNQIWESLDPRDVYDGQARQVRVVAVGAEKVLVESLTTGSRSSIALKRFCGKTCKGFKLVAPLQQTLAMAEA